MTWTWKDWYEFARAAFDFGEQEAVRYANARTVEEENRSARAREAPRRAEDEQRGASRS